MAEFTALPDEILRTAFQILQNLTEDITLSTFDKASWYIHKQLQITSQWWQCRIQTKTVLSFIASFKGALQRGPCCESVEKGEKRKYPEIRSVTWTLHLSLFYHGLETKLMWNVRVISCCQAIDIRQSWLNLIIIELYSGWAKEERWHCH